ncbi:MAG: tRNA pseudouridine(38-40) synthase TruA [Hyphomicrobium sp.]|jgi:tRNA pseudouridine38-40 synthase
MPRYRITIEYDGTPFVGWQIQAAGRSIQAALTDAIRSFSGEVVTVKGAGRTDAGVHARGQVAHFDLSKAWDPFRVCEAINFYLKPAPIVVIDCAAAPQNFDARFSATARHYRYRILTRRSPPALDRSRVWWVRFPLDAALMGEAATVLLGRHDFTTFRAAQCQAKSPVRTLDRLEVAVDGEEIRIEASARSFLHNQVRSMVGSLKLVGEGKWSAGDLARALEARDRTECGPVAPAAGLYLMAVDYDGMTIQRDDGSDAQSIIDRNS